MIIPTFMQQRRRLYCCCCVLLLLCGSQLKYTHASSITGRKASNSNNTTDSSIISHYSNILNVTTPSTISISPSATTSPSTTISPFGTLSPSATSLPSATGSPSPTATISPSPTVLTAAPTLAPTSAPTLAPTSAPTSAPTAAPTSAPTSAPTGNDNTQCIEFIYPNMSTADEPYIDICYSVILFGLGNSTWRTTSGQIVTNPKRFYNEYTILDHETWEPIYSISIRRHENYIVYLGITDDVQCQSYSYCGDDKYSADCTNIQYGRNVTCELIDEIFFPFTGLAATIQPKIITRAPTRQKLLPTRYPTQQPKQKRPKAKAPIKQPSTPTKKLIPSTKYPIKAPIKKAPKSVPIARPPTTIAPTGNDNTQCLDYFYPQMIGLPLDICYQVTMFGLGNGQWRFRNNTILTNPINFDNDYSIIDHETWEILYTISIKRKGNSTIYIGLKKNNSKCQSFSYCGNDKYKADCTNLMNGRNVTTCESAIELFFPFTQI